jgi:hypothetical protein
VNNTARDVSVNPARAAMLLAVEVLLADPEALGNDALEGDLYILRDRLREHGTPRVRTGNFRGLSDHPEGPGNYDPITR